MSWTQNYDPIGSPVLSTLLAGLPILVLLGLLATWRVPAQSSALAGLSVAVVAAISVFTPDETGVSASAISGWALTVLAAALNGSAFGLFPIGWIVMAAIFLYTLTVETGHFD